MGIGDCAQSPIPNPQSPIPNPQSPYFLLFYFNLNLKECAFIYSIDIDYNNKNG